jgi:hypothetical protein
MDANSLIEILSGRHFNMAERIERGIWPHPPLRFDDLVEQLAEVVSVQLWFPREFRPARPGEMVADVTVIERRGPENYVLHMQRSGPTGATIAASGSRLFTSPKFAASEFLKLEFRLPGDLDGWVVVA